LWHGRPLKKAKNGVHLNLGGHHRLNRWHQEDVLLGRLRTRRFRGEALDSVRQTVLEATKDSVLRQLVDPSLLKIFKRDGALIFESKRILTVFAPPLMHDQRAM
jgi:hypothetical protein